MKKLLLVLGLLLAASPLYAQDFGSVGTEWYYSNVYGGIGPPHSGYQSFKSVSDTVILGKNAHKLEVFYYTPHGNTSYGAPVYVYGENDTAFVFSAYKDKFVAIYVFNAQQGDTITLEYPEPPFGAADSNYQLKIDTISLIQIDGITLKQFKVSAIGFSTTLENTIIERIGGTQWFFPLGITIPEIPGPLRCYSDAQLDTNFFSFDCDYSSTSSVNELSDPFKITIYPNPASNQVFVSGPETGFQLRLFDLQGRVVLTAATSSDRLELAIDQLKRGVYTIEVLFTDGRRTAQRLLKQ